MTGRNADSLAKLTELGVTNIISLNQDDETIIKELKEINATNPIDIAIDYLWGHPIELIIKSLMNGGINSINNPVRIVAVGDIAGQSINLLSISLRSSAIEILGSGLGSYSQDELKRYSTELLPEMFQLAADNKLTMETQVEKLENIEAVWTKDIDAGKRLVITIN